MLDPALYERARLAPSASLEHHPELEHDEEIWIAFTEAIVAGMGGDGDSARACAWGSCDEWERHENFFLYDDALPALAELRPMGLRIGLISNGQRDLDEFAEHHELDVDVCVGSKHHGYVSRTASIFEAALAALDVAPADAAMVGDSADDDIEGARALGMQAVLLDRGGSHPEWDGAIRSLSELPAALGLRLAERRAPLRQAAVCAAERHVLGIVRPWPQVDVGLGARGDGPTQTSSSSNSASQSVNGLDAKIASQLGRERLLVVRRTDVGRGRAAPGARRGARRSRARAPQRSDGGRQPRA